MSVVLVLVPTRNLIDTFGPHQRAFSKKTLKSHPGCSCPSEYEGFHCEFLRGEAPAPTPPESSGTSAGSECRSTVVLFTVVVVVGVLQLLVDVM